MKIYLPFLIFNFLKFLLEYLKLKKLFFWTLILKFFNEKIKII